jgi:alkyl sulfatase BDS1-like metallo-beta-lactamase superfamily hydrolase
MYLPLLLSIIERSESRRGDLVGLVRSKNKTTTVSLGYRNEQSQSQYMDSLQSVFCNRAEYLHLIHLPMINMNLLLKIIKARLSTINYYHDQYLSIFRAASLIKHGLFAFLTFA